MKLEIRPLDINRWNDLVLLFGKTGADGGCWCMYWRLRQKDYQAGDHDRNRRALKTLVENGIPVGLIAYNNETPVGWCGLGPRETFKRLEHSRYLKRLDDKHVWSIVCFFIHSQYRRQGIASALIQAAIKYVAKQGAPALESYPILGWGSRVTTNSAYTGTVEMFEKAGFREVKVTKAKSGGQPRAIMRFNFTH